MLKITVTRKSDNKKLTLYIDDGLGSHLRAAGFSDLETREVAKCFAGSLLNNNSDKLDNSGKLAGRVPLISSIYQTDQDSSKENLKVVLSSFDTNAANSTTAPTPGKFAYNNAKKLKYLSDDYAYEITHIKKSNAEISVEDKKAVQAFQVIARDAARQMFPENSTPETFIPKFPPASKDDVTISEIKRRIIEEDIKLEDAAEAIATNVMSVLNRKLLEDSLTEQLQHSPAAIKDALTYISQHNSATGELEHPDLLEFKRKLLGQFKEFLNEQKRDVESAGDVSKFHIQIAQNENAKAIVTYVQALQEANAIKKDIAKRIYEAAIECFRKQILGANTSEEAHKARLQFNEIFQGILSINDNYLPIPLFTKFYENLTKDQSELQSKVISLLKNAEKNTIGLDIKGRLAHYISPSSTLLGAAYKFNEDITVAFDELKSSREAYQQLGIASFQDLILIRDEERKALNIPRLVNLSQEISKRQNRVQKNIDNYKSFLLLEQEAKRELEQQERIINPLMVTLRELSEELVIPPTDQRISSLVEEAKAFAALQMDDVNIIGASAIHENLNDLREQFNEVSIKAKQTNAFDDSDSKDNDTTLSHTQLERIQREINALETQITGINTELTPILEKQKQKRATAQKAINLTNALSKAENFEADFLKTDFVAGSDLYLMTEDSQAKFARASAQLNSMPGSIENLQQIGNEFPRNIAVYAEKPYNKNALSQKFKQHQDDTNALLLCHTLANCIWNLQYWNDSTNAVMLSGDQPISIPQEIFDMSQLLNSPAYTGWTTNAANAKLLFQALKNYAARTQSTNAKVDQFLNSFKAIELNNIDLQTVRKTNTDSGLLPNDSKILTPASFPSVKTATFSERHPIIMGALRGAAIGALALLWIGAVVGIAAAIIYATGGAAIPVILGAVGTAAAAVGGPAALIGVVAASAVAFVGGSSIIGAIKGAWNAAKAKQSAQQAPVQAAPDSSGDYEAVPTDETNPFAVSTKPQPAVQASNNPFDLNNSNLDPKPVVVQATPPARTSRLGLLSSNLTNNNNNNANVRTHELFVDDLVTEVQSALQNFVDGHYSKRGDYREIKTAIDREATYYTENKENGKGNLECLGILIKSLKAEFYPQGVNVDNAIHASIRELMSSGKYSKLNPQDFKGSCLKGNIEFMEKVQKEQSKKIRP